MSKNDLSLFLSDSALRANNLGFSRLVVVCYPQEIITSEAAKRCTQFLKDKDMMHLPA
jgi:uncharacterized protein YneR